MLDDWLVTQAIYEKANDLCQEGTLLRGEVDLTVSTLNCAFILTGDTDTFVFEPRFCPLVARFKYAEEALIKADVLMPGKDATLLSNAALAPWLKWLNTEVTALIVEAPVSSVICDFIIYESLRYFPLVMKKTAVDAEYRAYSISSAEIYALTIGRNPILRNASTLQDIMDLLIEATPITSIEEFIRFVLFSQRSFRCNICLEDCPLPSAVHTDCHHLLCMDCFRQYITVIYAEIHHKRRFPFLCPVPGCKCPFPLPALARALNPQEMEILQFKIDSNFESPAAPSHLIYCPLKSCGSFRMLRKGRGSSVVFCNDCSATWCEHCLERYKGDHDKCDHTKAMAMCLKYTRLKGNAKAEADKVYPWMQAYSQFKIDDGACKAWCEENASICPTCGQGIERISGCNHMMCTECSTHFCYNCSSPYSIENIHLHVCNEDFIYLPEFH